MREPQAGRTAFPQRRKWREQKQTARNAHSPTTGWQAEKRAAGYVSGWNRHVKPSAPACPPGRPRPDTAPTPAACSPAQHPRPARSQQQTILLTKNLRQIKSSRSVFKQYTLSGTHVTPKNAVFRTIRVAQQHHTGATHRPAAPIWVQQLQGHSPDIAAKICCH